MLNFKDKPNAMRQFFILPVCRHLIKCVFFIKPSTGTPCYTMAEVPGRNSAEIGT